MSTPKLFGWVPPASRTRDQHETHERLLSQMPRFALRGLWKDEPGQYFLWKFSQKVNGGKHIRYVNQVTGSCFPAGTPIRMADGSEKSIEDVRVGDSVVTHTGRHRSVVEVMQRDYDGDMVTVSVCGFAFPLTMTADHRVAVQRSHGLEWVRADDLEEGDRLLVGWSREDADTKVIDSAEMLKSCGEVIILDDLMNDGSAAVSRIASAKNQCKRSGADWRGKVKLVRSHYGNALRRFIPVCPSLARLVGLYLAEGGCDSGRVVFTFAGDEEHLAQEVLALVRGLFDVEGETFVANERGTARKVRFNNDNLAAFFSAMVPGNVYSKRVPGVFMHADEETKLSLLLGWMAGDGYAAKKKLRRQRKNAEFRIQGVTVSPDLARDMTTLALSCGIRASCCRRKARKQSKAACDVYLSGKKVVGLYPYLASASGGAVRFKNDTDTARSEFGYARRVTKIQRQSVKSLRVYDFEVEEDHSFIARGLSVHNCVGASSGNMVRSLAYVEIAAGQPEQFPVSEIWWVWTYGQGRKRAGLNGPGEGSFGSAQAAAATEDGWFSRDEYAKDNAALPDFQKNEGWIRLPSSVEMEWSDGAAKSASRPLGAKHLIKTAAPIKNSQDAKAALANGYPITIACMFGTKTIRATGSPAVQLATWDDYWPHQQSCQGCWDHPTLGLIFYILNQWGSEAHPPPLNGEPPGGYWIKASTFDMMLSSGEGFAFSAFDGFPVRVLDWYI